MAAADVTAIIVAYNSASVLGDCLSGVRGSGLDAIVVDNASTDATSERAAEAGAVVIANANNQGFGRAMNQGVAAAQTPYCLLLNPDVRSTPAATALLRQALEAAPRATLAAPLLKEPDGRAFALTHSPINPPLSAPRGSETVSVVSGAALLVRRDQFLALGGFDPHIFLFWEDNDLCRRVTDGGGEVLLVRAAEMAHARGASTEPASGHAYRMRWHQAWSRFYVFGKYGVASDAKAWIARFARKAWFARLTGDAARIERYEGSRDGARAYLSGETALAKEGLE